MKFSYPQIYLQEIPGEISLGISISGCNINCKGCHSKETWNKNFGEELTFDKIDNLLKKNKYATCFLFYGGEWDNDLSMFLNYIKSKGLKTALYSGVKEVDFNLIEHLDYYKIGPYIEELGGLNSINTNQRLYKIDNEITDITKSFIFTGPK